MKERCRQILIRTKVEELRKELADAIVARDYPQVQGTVLLIGCAVILVNMIVDIVYRFLDPRIKL